MRSSRGTSEYQDKLETNQSSSSEWIYTDDSSEEEVGLYALETIPKVGALSDQRVQGGDNRSTPCVLIKRSRGAAKQDSTKTRPSTGEKEAI